MSAPRIPSAAERWRCGSCGNLTRFDVVVARRTQEFWHLGLSGEPAVDESTALAEAVESVTCRWCGRSDAIDYVRRGAAPPEDSPTTTGDQPGDTPGTET